METAVAPAPSKETTDMLNSQEELLEKYRRTLAAGTREEDLMRRGEATLFVARRAAFQKLAGELEAEPDETPLTLAQQILTYSMAIDRTNDLRRVMRGDPTTWGNQLESLDVPVYDGLAGPDAVAGTEVERLPLDR
jgi:hypothetical protein